MTPTTTDHTAVAIVGAGSIGGAWAIVFASAGMSVRLYDLDRQRAELTQREAFHRLVELEAAGLLTESPVVINERISIPDSLEAAVHGVVHVQECIVERLDAKIEVFSQLDSLTSPEVVLASSTSTIMASRFAGELPGRDRCLVVHPGNPPYLLRVAEIVPADFTSDDVVARTRALLTAAEMSSIVLTREIEGFVFNRLQGALLREAFCLVRDEIVTPVELDTIVREGLGKRWSVVGPFATAELNTRGGLRRHAEIIGTVYARMAAERNGDNPWTPETVERVAKAIETSLPHADWEANVRHRDRAMISVQAHQEGLLA